MASSALYSRSARCFRAFIVAVFLAQAAVHAMPIVALGSAGTDPEIETADLAFALKPTAGPTTAAAIDLNAIPAPLEVPAAGEEAVSLAPAAVPEPLAGPPTPAEAFAPAPPPTEEDDPAFDEEPAVVNGDFPEPAGNSADCNEDDPSADEFDTRYNKDPEPEIDPAFNDSPADDCSNSEASDSCDKCEKDDPTALDDSVDDPAFDDAADEPAGCSETEAVGKAFAREPGSCSADSPCPDPTHCCSKFGFCGKTSAYCNAESIFLPTASVTNSTFFDSGSEECHCPKEPSTAEEEPFDESPINEDVPCGSDEPTDDNFDPTSDEFGPTGDGFDPVNDDFDPSGDEPCGSDGDEPNTGVGGAPPIDPATETDDTLCDTPEEPIYAPPVDPATETDKCSNDSQCGMPEEPFVKIRPPPVKPATDFEGETPCEEPASDLPPLIVTGDQPEPAKDVPAETTDEPCDNTDVPEPATDVPISPVSETESEPPCETEKPIQPASEEPATAREVPEEPCETDMPTPTPEIPATAREVPEEPCETDMPRKKDSM